MYKNKIKKKTKNCQITAVNSRYKLEGLGTDCEV